LNPAASQPAQTFHLLEPRPYPAFLSLVIPMYNEEAVLGHLRTEVSAFLAEAQGPVEVILVNDGSSDHTLLKALEWAKADPRVKVIQLSRNFGHQLAATAGLDYAAGDAVVLLDADLQDPLPVVHHLVERYREGYDVVYGQRQKRFGESLLKRATAWGFYRLMKALVYHGLPVDTGDFRLISRQCLTGLQAMQETHRFLRGMVAWVGFPQCGVLYERAPRISGRTKYTLRKMLSFAWTAATSFSILPLQISLLLGLLVGLFGIEEAVRALLAFILGWYVVPGWTSLVILTALVGAALLVSVGILGQYVGKIYEQSKARPLYLVSKTFNIQSDAGSGKGFSGAAGDRS
jgi:glycosyltransferase involved in cell wall biosynthesis